MRILFYIEPLVERENPEWKKGWITHFVNVIATALRGEGCEESALGCIAPTALGSVARGVIPTGRIATIDQSELVPRFGSSALEVATGWYRQTLGESALDAMANLIKNRLGDFSPDICLTFSPAPFLKRAFPGCKVFHLEYGLVSRPPFPETIYFDPIGMFQSGSLAKFAHNIKAYSPVDEEVRLLGQFREDFCHVLQGNTNPLHEYIGEKVRQFESAILLALQFSNFYAYDAHGQFKDQYDLLIYTLESAPRNVGVVVCEHPEHLVLTDSTIQYLRLKYPNFIWHRIFREVYSASYYLMSYVQGVVTVSSSVGLQTLLWKKRLAVVGSSHLDLIADTHEVRNLIAEINSEWAPWKEAVAAWLLSHFHLPFHSLCSSGKLVAYLQNFQSDDFETFSQSTARLGMDANFWIESYKTLAEKKWIAPPVDSRISDPSIFHAALYHETADHPADEKHCVRRLVCFENQNEVVLAFPVVDRKSPLLRLRFDPTNKPMNVFLNTMWLSDKWGNRVWEWNGSREVLGTGISGLSLFESQGTHGAFLVCHISDPQISLPIAPDVLAGFEGPITLWVVMKSADPALLEATVSSFQTRIQTTEKELHRASAEHKRFIEERLSSLYNRMLTKEGELRQVAAQLARIQEEHRELCRQLDGIYSSLMWRIMNRIRTMRERLCPDGSRRGRVYEGIVHWLKTSDRPEARRTQSTGGSLDRVFQIANTILPVSPPRKDRLVSFVFKRFGFVFAHTDNYQRWKERQPQVPQDHRTHNLSSESDAHSANPSPVDLAENAPWDLDCATVVNNGPDTSSKSPATMSTGSTGFHLTSTNTIGAVNPANGGKITIMNWNGVEPPVGVGTEGAASQVELAISQGTPHEPLPLVRVDQDGVDKLVQSFSFSYEEHPLVSIVIPVYNHLEYTVCCLASLLNHVSQSSLEVIIVDDASFDDTPNILPSIKNIKYVRNEKNVGFLHSCNTGARVARGKFLVFLNNDTQVNEGWLDELVKTFRQFSDVGLVGSKLLYPNGMLQEAGAIIKPDGSAELVGLNTDPARPEYNVVREVDYCSGACLLIEAEVFKILGGFDEIYSPCYCEDSDLAFRVRKMGKRVLYQPRSVVVHHLSVSIHDSEYAKMPLVARNTHIFVQRWSDELKKLNEVRAIAFYLPQYHPIPENDRWWGKGFTEWTNVTKARPNFEGHYQPHLPADLGFYDLRIPEVREEQARLASHYGISAFCYYYYWFAGKKLLNRPLDEVLESGAPDFPFCICWANENWTRRWDGCEEDILIGQNHADEDHAGFIADITPILMDKRYVRIQGKPLLIVYRLGLVPEPRRMADLWREYCVNQGIGEIYLAYVQSFEPMPMGDEPGVYGFDAAIEFPPHRYSVRAERSRPLINPEYQGQLFDYVHTSENFINRPWPSYKLFRTVMPSWDNTARRQDVSHVFVDATPERYEYWLRKMVEQTRRFHFGNERIVFINAWNEWAEGNHLEPDIQFGHEYLVATKNGLG